LYPEAHPSIWPPLCSGLLRMLTRVVQFYLFKEKIDRIYKINRIKINRNLVNPVNPVKKRVD
jgi:hypothetical protein